MLEYGYIKIASAIPAVNVADCNFNTDSICRLSEQAYEKGAEIILFPELSISAYSCGDLFSQTLLLDNCNESIRRITEFSKKLTGMLIVAGAPIRNGNNLYDCAVAIQNGKVQGVIPKSHIPSHGESDEKRWFSSAMTIKDKTIFINGQLAPFSPNIIFSKGEAKIAIEIGEDLFAPIPKSSNSAIYGANVILNPAAASEAIGKNEFIESLISKQSASTNSAYIYSSCGYGESTTDLVFGGKALICENGKAISESQRFCTSEQIIYNDIDIERLNNERRNNSIFSDFVPDIEYVNIELESQNSSFSRYELNRNIDPMPFIPNDSNKLYNRCEEIINIQSAGLMKRLQFTNTKNAVIGISGGLDSTLALLITVNTFDKLGLDRKGIHGITMPGFGTTNRTYQNALDLMEHLKISVKEISIKNAVVQHFNDIEHDIDNHNVTYENSQARERTQILMDYANKVNGMVIGTGDLSELALGWATYNGDHMSMYGVNASIPKTLVKFLVKHFALKTEDKVLKNALIDITDTPISPELLPSDNNGNILQQTEDLVGPYELHDFFIYNVLRNGFTPKKIYFLAQNAFKGKYDNDTIKKWLRTFFRRFFTQQFKRSCLPDGPKVGSVGLSPRGDLKMPSDASYKMWIEECDTL